MRLFETLRKELKKWKPINFEIMAIKSYIETNENRFLDELFSLIRIPSVSAQQEHKPDMETALYVFRKKIRCLESRFLLLLRI